MAKACQISLPTPLAAAEDFVPTVIRWAFLTGELKSCQFGRVAEEDKYAMDFRLPKNARRETRNKHRIGPFLCWIIVLVYVDIYDEISCRFKEDHTILDVIDEELHTSYHIDVREINLEGEVTS